MWQYSYRGADKSLARPGRKQATEGLYPIYNHNWRNISTIYIHKTILASNEIFSPSNKIHREVGRVKDLSAPRYYFCISRQKRVTISPVSSLVCV